MHFMPFGDAGKNLTVLLKQGLKIAKNVSLRYTCKIDFIILLIKEGRPYLTVIYRYLEPDVKSLLTEEFDDKKFGHRFKALNTAMASMVCITILIKLWDSLFFSVEGLVWTQPSIYQCRGRV